MSSRQVQGSFTTVSMTGLRHLPQSPRPRFPSGFVDRGLEELEILGLPGPNCLHGRNDLDSTGVRTDERTFVLSLDREVSNN